MSKTDGKRRNRKRIIIAGIGILLVLVIIFIVKLGYEKKGKEKQGYELGDGIVIERVEPYSGAFWEDGSDREVRKVWALTVSNTSDEDIQYLKITGNRGEETAEFEITTLPAGSKVNVLERTAKEYPEDEKMWTYQVENLAKFRKERSLHKDIFAVSTAENWVKVENHSEQDIQNDIYVYYKNQEHGIFDGGITYRARISGGLKSGEIKEQQTQHFDPKKSRIMYLTYE